MQSELTVRPMFAKIQGEHVGKELDNGAIQDPTGIITVTFGRPMKRELGIMPPQLSDSARTHPLGTLVGSF